jgi:Mn-dependent DtxR family transcriptional regulator
MNYIIDNRDLLLKAIEEYDIYRPQGRDILKVLVLVAEGELATITVSKLIELSGVSRQGTYNTLKYLENDKVIEHIKAPGLKLNSFRLNTTKLNSIVKYYQQTVQAKTALSKK